MIAGCGDPDPAVATRLCGRDNVNTAAVFVRDAASSSAARAEEGGHEHGHGAWERVQFDESG